jgi:hypothetical protein
MYLTISLILSLGTALFEYWRGGEMVVIVSYGVIVPFLVIGAKFIFEKGRKFELLILFSIIFNAPASLFFHNIGFQYDRFLHFAMGLISAIFLALLLKKRSMPMYLIFSILFVGVFAWEGLQFSVDQIFGTKVFFDIVQPIEVDVLEDIVFGLSGVIVGLFYVNKSYEKSLMPKV